MRLRIPLLLGVAAALLCAGPVQAKLGWPKKAKPYDAAATSCLSCHTKEKPKKGDPLSERGQWLADQKKARQAKAVDLAWLKDYPGNGK
jgi:cytochrome c553